MKDEVTVNLILDMALISNTRVAEHLAPDMFTEQFSDLLGKGVLETQVFKSGEVWYFMFTMNV